MSDKPIFAARVIDGINYGISHLSANFNILDNPPSELKASIALFPSLASISKQPDLLYISAVLASAGANNNRDYFAKEDLIRAHNTAIDKRISDNHGDEIIGHMTSSWLVDDKCTILNNEQAAASKDRIHVGIGGVIYKYHYPTMAEDIKKSAGGKGNQRISMEALFPECALMIGDDGKEVIASSDPRFNDIYGYWSNLANYKGKPVYRKLIGHFFSGSGITKNPANPPSIILSAASDKENCNPESGCILIDFGKVNSSEKPRSCKTEAKNGDKENMSGEPDLKAIAFEIEGDEAQAILNEVYDEGVNEGVSSEEESDAGSRPSKKKSGKRSAPKDYPKKSEDYGDPANHSFPIDTKDRVTSALQRFFKFQSLLEYTVSEKLYILRKIVSRANKFGIKVSDDILRSAHISSSEAEQHGDTEEMTKKMKEMMKEAETMKGDEKDKMMMKIEDMKKKIKEMKASVDDGAQAKLGLDVPKTQPEVNTSSKLEEKGNKMAEDTKELDSVKAELAKAKEALATKDKEMESLKAESTKVSEKVKTDLEAKDKVIAEKDGKISEMQTEKVMASRIKELTDAGLIPEVEADVKEQADYIKALDDKAFAFFKKSLVQAKEKASKKDPAKEITKAETKTEAIPAPNLDGAKPVIAAQAASVETKERDLRSDMSEI